MKLDYPDHLPVHTAMLTSLDSSDAPRFLPHDDLSEVTINFCSRIINIADEVIKAIDQDKLLAYYGLKTDPRPDASKIKSTMDKQKNCLIEALVKKGCALARLYVSSKKKNDSEENKVLVDGVSNSWTDVLKFAEATDNKVSCFEVICMIYMSLKLVYYI